jgi:hypothetical protein
VGNPFLDATAKQKPQETTNPFLTASPTRKTGGSVNPFLIGKKSDDIEEKVAELEQQAAEFGAREPDQDSPGLFRRVVDVLSRPNYAVAGATEELLQGKGVGAALGRAGSELASGIGDIKGQKEGFGQVLEQQGVGKLGSLGTIPEWVPLLHGTEITGRGAIGLGLDIVADPLNLVTAGAGKGIMLAGKSIPGTARTAAAVGSAIRSVPMYDKVADVVGRTFNRDWGIRNLPGAVELKQAHLTREAIAKDELYTRLGASSVAKVPKARRAEFVDAIDDGTAELKFANDPEMLQAAQEWKALNDEWAATEVTAGLIEPASVRANYVAHFYENTPEELFSAVNRWRPHTLVDKESLGRHAEMRAFDTLKQAEDWTRAQNAIDRTVPVLKPLRDPLEILRRRGDAHIQAVEFQKYYDEIRAKFGKADIPFNVQDFFDLQRVAYGGKMSAQQVLEWRKVTAAVSKGGTDINVFRNFSEEGRKEFMRQRLLRATEASEVPAILNKYGVENAPKQTRLLGTVAPDGTPYVPVHNIGRLKGAEIPSSLRDDLADMSERVFKGKELDHMLRYYDRLNNTFKAFVTLPFPAFHFRNAYSNLALGFADAGASVLNPARHYDGWAGMRGLDGGMTTKAGEFIPYKQLQQEMREGGVLQSGRQILEYTGQQGIDRVGSVAGKARALPRKVGAAIENEARAALYTIHRRRGLDAVTAAQRVNEFLFDYSNLSRIERDLFRRMIPFYTFTRKNLERQFKNLATRPGRVAAQVKPFRGREDEDTQMTSWEGEALKLRLNKDGRTLRVITGVDLPIKQVDLVFKGSLRETARGALGMITPLLKTPIEVATGVNLFTGRGMTRQNSALVGKTIEALDPPEGIKNWLGYRKDVDQAGRPRYSFDGERFYILFQSYAMSRLVSTSDRQFRTFAESAEWGPVLLDFATGLRNKSIDLDAEKSKKLNERIRQLEDNAIRRGYMREHRSVYVPKNR